MVAEISGKQTLIHPELQNTDQNPAGKEKHGFLGSRSLVGAESATNNETMTIMYFKTAEHIQAFATGPLHRKSLAWWAKHAAEYPHLGIFHETYQVRAKNWETVYAHTKPMMAGATQHKVQGGFSEKGGEEAEYKHSLVYAKGVLKTSSGRMGRLPGTFDRSVLEVKEAGKAEPMMV
jgi:heme-degrading monooxygenase HmoA